MKVRYALLPMITICTAAIALGQGKFDGTWQLNQGKSQLAGDTMQYSDVGNGELKFTSSVQTYVIKTDGSPIQTPLGGVRTFKKVDDQTYENSLKRNGVCCSRPSGSSRPTGRQSRSTRTGPGLTETTLKIMWYTCAQLERARE